MRFSKVRKKQVSRNISNENLSSRCNESVTDACAKDKVASGNGNYTNATKALVMQEQISEMATIRVGKRQCLTLKPKCLYVLPGSSRSKEDSTFKVISTDYVCASSLNPSARSSLLLRVHNVIMATVS